MINKKTGDQNQLYEVLGNFTVNYIKLFKYMCYQTGFFWRMYAGFEIEFELYLNQRLEEKVELISFSSSNNITKNGSSEIKPPDEDLNCFYNDKCWPGHRSPAIHIGERS